MPDAGAYSLFSDGGATESLDSLKTVYEHLQSLDLGDRVLIDLGLVNQAEYYTGLPAAASSTISRSLRRELLPINSTPVWNSSLGLPRMS